MLLVFWVGYQLYYLPLKLWQLDEAPLLLPPLPPAPPPVASHSSPPPTAAMGITTFASLVFVGRAPNKQTHLVEHETIEIF